MFNPCTRKSANMGHPSGPWWQTGNGGLNDRQSPKQSKVFISLVTPIGESFAPRDDKGGEGSSYLKQPLQEMDLVAGYPRFYPVGSP